MNPEEWTFDTVSSDAIRAKVMKPLLDSGKTQKEAFNMTVKSGPAAFGAEVARLCSEATFDNKGRNHIIFVDKNHPANGVKKIIDDLYKNIRVSNVNLKKLYLVPEQLAGKANRITDYPFSENFIA